MARLTQLAFVMLASIAGRGAWGQDTFVRGDVNQDGRVSLADAATVTAWVMGVREEGILCEDAADVRDRGFVELHEAQWIALRLFGSEALFPIAGPTVDPGPDPTPDLLDCESYDPTPAPETEEVVRIGDVEAAPGERVTIPVEISSTEPLNGLQLVLGYDPLVTPETLSLAEFTEGTVFSPQRPGGFLFADRFYEEERVHRIGFLPELLFSTGSPAETGEGARLANLPVRVSVDAEPGTTIRVSLVEHEDGLGPVQTELSLFGEARLPRTESGTIRVVAPAPFVRGDANRDGEINIADPVFLLSHLFTGGEEPSCPDAADADDDGALELTDAVRVLEVLFLGPGALPPPYPEPAQDPTSDGLPRCR